MSYEHLKGLVVKNDAQRYLDTVQRKDQITIGFKQSLVCSMVAGAFAAIVTNPLDMGKL